MYNTSWNKLYDYQEVMLENIINTEEVKLDTKWGY